MQSVLEYINRVAVDRKSDQQDPLVYLIHDIRSVVTSLSLMVDLLELGAKAGDDTVQRTRAASAQGSCQQMALLCGEASKHIAGRFDDENEPEEIDLLEVLTEAHAIYSPIYDLSGKTLNFVNRCQSARINGNRSQVFRAISNILDNGLRHTTGGGAVLVTCSEVLEGLVVSISDNGPGFTDLTTRKPQQIDTLPVVIRHISNSGDIFSPGTGLRYVSEIMTMHEGSSTVMRNENGGSSFTLTFPKQQAE